MMMIKKSAFLPKGVRTYAISLFYCSKRPNPSTNQPCVYIIFALVGVIIETQTATRRQEE